ncbi:Ger(x)C family spore germination protein [Viridibacillus sp. YIM B01967]|uniref:Ger(X)C family spore germination protein n=1 Tax=Viridibacillus soli TaxID=2798301 RepID=A0ABS1HDJ6_9BACL|nr:Ger(x)C family spore germination protein [Viridibacillus soli]MBK3497157.1 Ger(x)C family spore germination protein [Viridibacillus soli]
MNKRIAVIVMLLITILSGCWGAEEPERMLYIHGLGVDYKDGKYEVYAQIIDFSTTANTEQAPNNEVQAEVGHATGDTMDEAIFELYHTMDQKAFWGFLSYIIFSEEALKNANVNPVIDTLTRYRETRYQIWVYGTKEPIEDLLLITPIINKAIMLSQLGDPKNSYVQESFIKPVNLRMLIIGLNEPNHEMPIPFVSISNKWKSEEGPKDATSYSGVGVLSPNEFKGFIPAKKVRGLQWMSNETKRGEITVKIESSEEIFITVVVDKIKVKVEPIVRKEEVTFDIDVSMNAQVSDFEGNVTNDEIRKKVVKEVKKEIKDTYEEALKNDIDIYRLSEHVYRKNLKEWKKIQKDGKVELTEDSIRNLTVKINRFKSERKSYKETIKK